MVVEYIKFRKDLYKLKCLTCGEIIDFMVDHYKEKGHERYINGFGMEMSISSNV